MPDCRGVFCWIYHRELLAAVAIGKIGSGGFSIDVISCRDLLIEPSKRCGKRYTPYHHRQIGDDGKNLFSQFHLISKYQSCSNLLYFILRICLLSICMRIPFELWNLNNEQSRFHDCYQRKLYKELFKKIWKQLRDKGLANKALL